MKILWHWELHKDYSQFPKFDQYETDELVPSAFVNTGDQCRAFELWRLKQNRGYSLSVYLSHFEGFIPPAFDDDFFDFRCNIAERRYQSFYNALIANDNKESVLLFSPGLILEEDFDIEPWIEEAEQEQRLIVLTDKSHELLSGIWVIPYTVLDLFSYQGELDISAYSSDIVYWLALANSLKEPAVFEVSGFSNYLPEYTRAIQDYKSVSIKPSESREHNLSIPEWTDADFDEWIGKQTFHFAKTMRWCPHEYVYIWDRDLEDQKNVLMSMDYVYRNAVIDQWKDRYQIAVYRNGHKYWQVRAIDILNRTSKELERRIFLEDGKDEFGRKLQRELFD